MTVNSWSNANDPHQPYTMDDVLEPDDVAPDGSTYALLKEYNEAVPADVEIKPQYIAKPGELPF